jgi:DNA repair exonuclease SbcCD ATPase subunit/predicted phosphodiesterase
MKLLIWGDSQLESKPSHDRLDDLGKSIRFKENQETMRDIMKTAKLAGCEGMVHLGDLTEERNPDSATLTAAASIFGEALSWGWEIHAIAGNHDGAIFDLSSSSFEALGKLNEKFHVYHAPTCIHLFGHPILFVPYLHRKPPEEVMKLSKAVLGPKGASYMFAHYAYAGVTIGAKNMVLPGDNLDSSIFTQFGCKTAFFGHIHKQQVVQAPDNHQVVFPGSPFCCDFGERNDPKGYAILDTETGKWELFQAKPKRNWIQVNWRELGTKTGKFGKDDLVKVVGDFVSGENPQAAFKTAVASGSIQEPFFKTFDVKRAVQATKRGVVTAQSGLQQALADYVENRWPDNNLAKPALEAALGALKASSPAALDKAVVLTEVHMTDWLSHAKAEVKFTAGQPMLVCGENGLGKTNLIEAVLFALTGQVSKGLKMASLVRQGASKTSVTLFLTGDRGQYRITRTVTLNSKGAATHKVNVEMKAEPGNKWVSLADGGVADTQAALGRLVGATFLSMRAVNFQFQRDPNPFIGAEPSERKAILAEILGLDAIGRAFKILDEDRKVKMRVKDAAIAAYDEAASHYNPEEMTSLKSTVKLFEEHAITLGKALTQAKAVTEAAIAEAGAVGSERNSLQGVIDSLLNQADGATALKMAKVDLEATYKRTRDERVASYSAAKKRADEKAVLAEKVPALTEARAKAEAAVTKIEKQGIDKELENAIDDLEKASAKAAKASVDARLVSRKAQEDKSVASYDRDILLNKRAEVAKALDVMKSQDLKNCSKCGKPLDSAHAEKEIASMEAELVEFKTKIEIAEKVREEAINNHNLAETEEKKLTKIAEDASKALTKARSDAEAKANFAISEASQALRVAHMELEAAKLAANDAKSAGDERDALLRAGTEAKEAHEKSLADLDAKIIEAEKQFEVAKAKVEEARKSLATLDVRLAEKRNAVDAAKASESAAQRAVDSCASTIVSQKAAIASFEAIEANAKKRKEESDAAGVAWTIADMASKAMDPKAGLPVHLIDERLPALADAVNTYLNEFGSPEFSIGFSTRTEDDKETLEVLVDNGAEPRLDVAAYSGGQLDRIEFCLRMALGDLAEEMRDVRLGFVMMDEPGTHLDAEKKGALIKMVLERSADGRCPVAVIVSHDPKLMSAIPSKLIVTKDGMKEY